MTQCSRAGCHDEARHRIEWRNPRLHDAARVKTWLACDAHLPYLEQFLAARGFPVSVAALA